MSKTNTDTWKLWRGWWWGMGWGWGTCVLWNKSKLHFNLWFKSAMYYIRLSITLFPNSTDNRGVWPNPIFFYWNLPKPCEGPINRQNTKIFVWVKIRFCSNLRRSRLDKIPTFTNKKLRRAPLNCSALQKNFVTKFVFYGDALFLVWLTVPKRARGHHERKHRSVASKPPIFQFSLTQTQKETNADTNKH